MKQTEKFDWKYCDIREVFYEWIWVCIESINIFNEYKRIVFVYLSLSFQFFTKSSSQIVKTFVSMTHWCCFYSYFRFQQYSKDWEREFDGWMSLSLVWASTNIPRLVLNHTKASSSGVNTRSVQLVYELISRFSFVECVNTHAHTHLDLYKHAHALTFKQSEVWEPLLRPQAQFFLTLAITSC